MKFKEILEKWFKDPKKFLTNIAVAFLIGVLLLIIGDVTGSLFNFKKDKSNAEKLPKETVQKEDDAEVEVSSNSQSFPGAKDYEEKLKRDLADSLIQIQGVGKVDVMIYFQGSSESIPAVNSTDTNKKTDEKDKEGGTRTITESSKTSTVVTAGDSSGNKALIVKEIRPSIGGVMIVAEGAVNSSIKEEVTNAVKTLLNLPANKVVVSPMKKS
ncbi:stage III sporulation protein AG [Clostridium cylindrosporum]|uniref:Stage III sporulation protein AG n=1 Tax=Clostridium cylindrosporum DSM 605 TaxID=1121307 RepID=A0A0J8D5B2_CLOCY|nr:stage III sporulation protein AG [Clostridium cylindrosporum]KMT21345.1 stage III sporulation protein AG [Clostridium cylindrosporum DSM 605]